MLLDFGLNDATLVIGPLFHLPNVVVR